MKAAIAEIGKLHKFTQSEAKKQAVLDRREGDHHKTIVKDLFSAHERTLKDIKARDDRTKTSLLELQKDFEQKIEQAIENSE